MRTTRWLGVLALVWGCGDVVPLGGDATPPPDSGNQTIDAAMIDAPPPDAAPQPVSFEIAYVNRVEVRKTTGVGAPFTGLVINVSDQPIDISTLQVISSEDDHPDIIFEAKINNSSTNTAMPPGVAHGQLTQLGAQPLVMPLVSEPWTDMSRPTIDWTLNLPANIDADVNASAVLQIGDEQVTLDWVFQVRNADPLGTTFLEATRTKANP